MLDGAGALKMDHLSPHRFARRLAVSPVVTRWIGLDAVVTPWIESASFGR